MICSTTIHSTSSALKKLVVNENYHSSYSHKEFNDKKEEIISIFSAYVSPQIKEIHHPELLQERKLNLDAAEHKNNMKANMYKPSEKNKKIVLIVVITGQHHQQRQLSGFLFLIL